MKNLHTLLSVASVVALVGCANGSVPEPAPGPSAVANPAPSPANLGALAGDVTPVSIHARGSLAIARDLVQVSQPVSPKDKIFDEGAPEWALSTDALNLVAKGTATSEIAIDDTSGEAMLYLVPQAEGSLVDDALAGLEVFDPDGVQINKRAFKAGTKATPMPSVALAGHKPGIYRIKHSTIAQRFALAVDARLMSSKLVMKMKPSTLQHLYGNTTTVDVMLEDNGAPVTGAKLAVSLVDPELKPGNRVQVTEIGGGIYRADVSKSFGVGDRVGAWLVDVRAEGRTAAGTPFLRHGRTGFHFGVPTAKISSVGAVHAITNDKGITTGFAADLELDSASLDRLEISGTLAALGSDGAEHPVALAFSGGGYGAGKHTVTLTFDASYVRMTHLAGPYVLRNVKLFSLGTNTLFQRIGNGENRVVSGPRLEQLALPKMTPALEQLVTEGTLFDK